MTNCTTYYFERIKREYYQYPLDYASDIFQTYEDSFGADSQIVVHRHPNLVYYTYMKRLSDDSYFGISILINSLETDNIKSLFKLFEKVFQQIISDGVVLTISPAGDIALTQQSLNSSGKYLNGISITIERYIGEGRNHFREMRPVNYSANDDYIIVSDNDSSIRQRLSDYNKVFIEKNSGTALSGLNGYMLKIKNLTEQLEYQKERNAELEKRIKNTAQGLWRYMAIICIVIIAVIIAALIYGKMCGFLSFDFNT